MLTLLNNSFFFKILYRDFYRENIYFRQQKEYIYTEGKILILYIKYFCSVELFNGYVYATTCCSSELREFLLHFSE